MTRFSNPRILDTTRRVAADGASKHPGFILPILKEQLAAGRSFDGLALAEAGWARMCAGAREDGSPIEVNEPMWDTLNATAKAAKNDPRKWIEQRAYYGDLAKDSRFSESFSRWLAKIWADGAEATLRAYVSGA